MINDSRLIRLEKVLSSIAPAKRLAIAFSGGLDSRFLSFAAKYLGYEVKLLAVKGPHISPEETAEAVQWAKEKGFELELLVLNPLQMKAVEFNQTDRCYFCKKHLFLELRKRAADLPLCDGTNHSDLSHYRPGLKALIELKIHSPLAEASFSKQDNREIGALIGLDHWDQAARPCMLTRLPYNQKVLASDLVAVGQAEAALNHFFTELNKGEIHFRLRKVSSKAFEVHIQKEDFERLSEEERSEASLLLAAFPLFKDVQWKATDTLSGYFDQLLGKQAH